MQIRFITVVCFVLFWSDVSADVDNEVKRGAFPYMAFVYYPDETVVDSTGYRFVRAASLIKPEWLLSSAIDHSDLDGMTLGFPRKTLLARLGAVTIDVNITLNEDEDEQEIEVIQIIRPRKHNVEVWWQTDITLLKTLLPFKTTSAIAPANINLKREYTDKDCHVLVYTKKFANTTDYKVLIRLAIELLPPSMDNCGGQFSEGLMTCGVDKEEAKAVPYDPDYCTGNSGGPLICDNEIMAIQTYIENNCKQPHLYTLLSAWEHFITCGVEERCDAKYKNCNVCTVFYKDSLGNYVPPATTTTDSSPQTSTGKVPATETDPTPTAPATTMHQHETTVVEETEAPTTVPATETEPVATTTTEPSVPSVPISFASTTLTASTTQSTTPPPSSAPPERKEQVAADSTVNKWPSEKPVITNIKKIEESDDTKREPKAEAQHQKDDAGDVQPGPRSAAPQHLAVNLVRTFFAYLVIACMM